MHVVVAASIEAATNEAFVASLKVEASPVVAIFQNNEIKNMQGNHTFLDLLIWFERVVRPTNPD